jgi:hypothetical protein
MKEGHNAYMVIYTQRISSQNEHLKAKMKNLFCIKHDFFHTRDLLIYKKVALFPKERQGKCPAVAPKNGL